MRKSKTIRILAVAMYLCLLLLAALPYQHNNFIKVDFPSMNKIPQHDSFQDAVCSSRQSESKAFVSVIPRIIVPSRINFTKKLYHSVFLTPPVNTKSFALRC
jgi:hypothetical protein